MFVYVRMYLRTYTHVYFSMYMFVYVRMYLRTYTHVYLMYACIVNNIHCMYIHTFSIPYIANRSRWKSFLVIKLNCNLLESNRNWTIALYIWLKPIA